MIKLNLGESKQDWQNQKAKGWTAVDIKDQAELVLDLTTKPLPWDDNSVDMIYCAHFIEHIQHDQARSFIRECYRILKPNGIIRMVWPQYSYTKVPQMVVLEYLSGSKPKSELCGEELETVERCPSHLYAYSIVTMMYELERVGFRDMIECAPAESKLSTFDEIAFLDYTHRSNLVVEARK